MTTSDKDKLDPGFWIGLVLVIALLYLQQKCKGI